MTFRLWVVFAVAATADYIGRHASRVVVTEWGGAMSPGTKNGVSFDTTDYNIPSGSYFSDYIRGVARKMRSLGVGSVYWPGLRDGDWYSMRRKNGSGSSIILSLVNQPELDPLHYAWGTGDGGSDIVKIRNVATGLYLDGPGRTADGSTVGQSSGGSSLNQRWIVENGGYHVRLKSRATGLYLDGMGRSANGADAGQWSDSNSTNQQWRIVAAS